MTHKENSLESSNSNNEIQLLAMEIKLSAFIDFCILSLNVFSIFVHTLFGRLTMSCRMK
jgi:hypothetical protein